MLTSMALILLGGLLAGRLFTRLKLPGLLGMMLIGMALSPYALNGLDASTLMISGDIRQIALVIILTRAGLTLQLDDLKRVGRPAVLMCFVPACAEIIGTVLIAPLLFDISVLDAAVIGSLIAAVSPAVVVPRMIRLIEEGYGKSKSIPQLILAGAAVDDVFVIVVFTALTALAKTGETSAAAFAQIPVSMGLGILLGWAAGRLMTVFFRRFPMQDTLRVLMLLSVSFLMVEAQNRLALPVSGLLAVMSMGMVIRQRDPELAIGLSGVCNRLWSGAEIFLFVLVGAAVDLRYAWTAGLSVVTLVAAALVFRMAGVALSLLRTPLNRKERLFCMTAYTPKATVQAAIGTVPLAMGLSCGSLALTVAVISILLTAPFGAICIDRFYRKWLTQ